jgi:hypothetical protein
MYLSGGIKLQLNENNKGCFNMNKIIVILLIITLSSCTKKTANEQIEFVNEHQAINIIETNEIQQLDTTETQELNQIITDNLSKISIYQEGYDFGNYKWNTNIDIIKMNEGIPDSEEIRINGVLHKITYNKIFEGYPAEIIYLFYQKKLIRVDINFQNISSLDDGVEIYIDIFNKYNYTYGKAQYYLNSPVQVRNNFEDRLNNPAYTTPYLLANWSWSYENRDFEGIDDIYREPTFPYMTNVFIGYKYYKESQKSIFYIEYISPDYHTIMSGLFP